MKAQPASQIEPRNGEPRPGTSQVTERIAKASPRLQARMAGVIDWITTTAGFAAIVSGNLVVYGDAAATAHNILAHELLFRLAVAGDVIATLYIAYTLLLYNLFRPVNRSLSLLAAFFSLVGSGVGTLNTAFELAPLIVLGSTRSLGAFNVEQLQALALMFLKMHAQVYNIGLVLFGIYNLLIGYLIFRSTFMPRVLGMLYALAGLGYATYLFPPLANALYPINLAPAALAEPALMLWLLIVGVNVKRWNERASRARS